MKFKTGDIIKYSVLDRYVGTILSIDNEYRLYKIRWVSENRAYSYPYTLIENHSVLITDIFQDEINNYPMKDTT